MSKLNPQKASAYVGPGVLRKGGKITPVPNGPLVKKKGVFKGSTLKSGGSVKKKQGGGGFGNIMGMVGGLMGGGGSKKDDSKKEDPLEATKNKFENSKNLLGNSLNKVNKQLVANQTPDVRKSLLKAGGKMKKAQGGEYLTKEGNKYTSTKKVNTNNGPRYYQGTSPSMSFSREIASNKARKINDSIPKAKLSARALEVMNQKNGGKIKKAQNGEFKIGKKTYTTTKAANDTIKKPERTIWVNNPMPPSKTKKTGIDALVDRATRGYKTGGMIKRADGSYSKRGLWDNIRANKGSGKKPTKQMLQQEKKIKAKTKK